MSAFDVREREAELPPMSARGEALNPQRQPPPQPQPPAPTAMPASAPAQTAAPAGELGSVANGVAPNVAAARERLADPTLSEQDRARLQAQIELQSRFQVVPDDFQGKKLPNQLTQAEFERYTAMYGDIRTGHSDIQFDETRMRGNGMDEEAIAKFREGTMNDMASLLQTESGRALLGALHEQKSDHKTRLIGNGPPGADSPNHTRMDGKGANADVRYVPGENSDIPGALPVPWMPTRSDVTLMHELTHAMHMTQGTMAGMPLHLVEDASEPGGIVQPMEQQAVGLGPFAGDDITENRYRAERAALGAALPQESRAGDRTMARRTSYMPPMPAAPPPRAAAPLPEDGDFI